MARGAVGRRFFISQEIPPDYPMIRNIYAHSHEWKILLRNRARRGKNVLHNLSLSHI